MHTVHMSLYVIGFLVILALLFDFMNGFHDAANAIATVVSTGVLKPQQAVAMAAFFNVIAILFFQLKNAAIATACCGLSTPVDTTVAIAFAASWKPFIKSNNKANITKNPMT